MKVTSGSATKATGSIARVTMMQSRNLRCPSRRELKLSILPDLDRFGRPMEVDGSAVRVVLCVQASSGGGGGWCC